MRKASLLGITVLVALAACRHDPSKPPVFGEGSYPARPAEGVPLPPLSPEMTGALEGRTVFIDPGHGGPFTGMIAPSNGIHEADVNLDVALNLRDRLEGYGATVLMSRNDDTVLVPDSLSQDLSARAAMSNAAEPDVFISIHHNADVVAQSQKDDLEVYYKLGDDMASLDLGRCLISALGRGIRFDTEQKLLLPGNYKVLRENEAPSVLLETAYLTNDHDAAYLAAPEGVDDEVRSIVYGLAAYFALDPPKADEVIVGSDELAHGTDSTSRSAFEVRFSRGLPIDLDTVSVTCGGEDTYATILPTEGGFDWALPGSVPNGSTTYDITGRNMRGAGFHVRRTVEENRPPAAVRVTQYPRAAGPGNLVLFEVGVTDATGSPVMDGTPVRIESVERTAMTRGGFAKIYFEADELLEAIHVECDGINKMVIPVRGRARHQTITVENAATGEAVSRAFVWSGNTIVGATNAEGWIALAAGAGPYRIRRDGFEDTKVTFADGHAVLALAPLHGGALLGRRIAIDPAHGGRVAGVRAFDGTRASDLNLDVARRLGRLLRRSGAEIVVTRAGDDEVADPQRITETEAFSADLLLVISFGAPVEETRPLDPVGHLRHDITAFVGHYPQSIHGIRAANAIAGELGVQITACVSYMVQQSQSPALHVQPASLDFRAPNDAPFDAESLRRIANSIHRGLITYFSDLDAGD